MPSMQLNRLLYIKRGGAMSDKEKVKQEVTIIWGMDKETKETYTFDTIEELNAFFYGIDQCFGWHEWELEGEQ